MLEVVLEAGGDVFTYGIVWRWVLGFDCIIYAQSEERRYTYFFHV